MTIAKPQQIVFAYLTEPCNAKEWNTELVDVRDDGELRQGTTGSDIRRFGAQGDRDALERHAVRPAQSDGHPVLTAISDDGGILVPGKRRRVQPLLAPRNSNSEVLAPG